MSEVTLETQFSKLTLPEQLTDIANTGLRLIGYGALHSADNVAQLPSSDPRLHYNESASAITAQWHWQNGYPLLAANLLPGVLILASADHETRRISSLVIEENHSSILERVNDRDKDMVAAEGEALERFVNQYQDSIALAGLAHSIQLRSSYERAS